MPTYAYACTVCEHRFEAQQSFTDSSLTVCPECAGRLRKIFPSVGVVFKGSGFYRNDSRSGKGAMVPAGASSNGESGSSGSSDSGDSGSATKPSTPTTADAGKSGGTTANGSGRSSGSEKSSGSAKDSGSAKPSTATKVGAASAASS